MDDTSTSTNDVIGYDVTENMTSENDEYDYSVTATRVRSKFFIMAFIIPFGLLFNTTAFAVFMRSSSLRKATTTHFLIALTFADSTYLIGELLNWLNTDDPYWSFILGLNFRHTNATWCRITYFLRYFGQFFSAWLTVAITVERCLCVSFPLKIGQLSTKLTTRVIIITICIVSVALNSYPFWVYDLVHMDSYIYCKVVRETRYAVWTWAIFRIGALLLPSTIVFIFTGLILMKLHQMAQVRRNMAQQTDNPSSKDEKQIIVMLLLVAIAFLILRLPYNVSLFLHEYVYSYTEDTLVAQNVWLARDVTYAIASLNYAVNFFLFCMSGSIFRQKLKGCLMCKTKSEVGSRSSRVSRTTYTSMSSITKFKIKSNSQKQSMKNNI